MSTTLYIGRFQPLHLGHLSAIKQALKKANKLLIGIGSSQYSNTLENPFTAEERQNMLEIALKEAGIEEKCDIYLIPDIHDEKKWVEHVKAIVPSFDSVVVGNEGLVKKLFEEKGVKVKMVEQELNTSATKVREEMRRGGAWEEKVSSGVAEYLKSIQAEERVRKVE